ncbi:uncharacterized protein LOC141559000 isoform X2 [Sminthopsis crassicaudata]|uniref:uncharacterized protein LOC141559000 isoform X2 n=1 Tax=Sminthopsis crassicaudata TaxID=9301 RepID=UPI003D69EF95
MQLVKMYQRLSSEEDLSSPAGKMEYQPALQSKLKVLEQENAQLALVIQRWKLDQGATLQMELDACKQQLELERNLSLTLQHQLRGLQSGSAPQGTEPPQAAPGPGPCPPGATKGTEAEPQWDPPRAAAEPQKPLQGLPAPASGSPQAPELPQPAQGAPAAEADALRQQLQKEESLRREWEQRLQSLSSELQELKLRKPEEPKVPPSTAQDSGRQGLEAAESQLQESRKENFSLELLVASLRQKLEEKEQALKELLSPGASEHSETELTPSSLLKLPPHSRSGVSRLLSEELRRGPQAGWEGVPQAHCSHCNAFLEQLHKVLQGWEPSSKPSEEKPQPLRQLQKVLEGPNKHVPKGARATRNDLKDVERVRQQHRLVTEELQDLFGERRERTIRAAQPPREWPEGSSGDQGAKKPPAEQANRTVLGLPPSSDPAGSSLGSIFLPL